VWAILDGTPNQWRREADGQIYAHSTTFDTVLVSTKLYYDFNLSVVASTTNREASLAVRMRDAGNGYRVIFAPLGDVVMEKKPYSQANAFISLRKVTDGKETTLGTYSGRLISSSGSSARITVQGKGPWLHVFLNGVTVLRIKDTDYPSGFIGLRIFGDEEYPCDAVFSQLRFSRQ
jgi:hypothetical protein